MIVGGTVDVLQESIDPKSGGFLSLSIVHNLNLNLDQKIEIALKHSRIRNTMCGVFQSILDSCHEESAATSSRRPSNRHRLQGRLDLYLLGLLFRGVIIP